MSRPEGPGVDVDGTSVLTSIHDANENQWNNLVTHAEHGTLFHRYEWLAAVEDGLGYEPCHVLVTEDSNPVAVLPNFISALSVPDGLADSVVSALDLTVIESGPLGHGGPVIAAAERENVDKLFDALDATASYRLLCHRISTYDLEQIRYGQYLQTRGYEPQSISAGFFLNLTNSWDDLLADMAKSRRKDVRQAHEQDYRVEIDPLGTDLAITYDMYEKNMARVDGSRVPYTFLEDLRDSLTDRVRVFSAYVDDELVGKYVYLLDTENSTLHHWLSAIPDRDCYDSYPSELMHSRAIRWGGEREFEQYSFGSAGSYFDNSVFRFKHQYGARAVPILHWERGETRLMYSLFKLGRRRVIQRQLNDGRSAP